ncbi:disulfide oxidoreductase [Metabacillus iocasae]|uniref:Probable disulfide formation protein n=1 Tax=Priestia iocasae TaxID=2291674 RepID=A0ABS2QTG2_9BACI|nr:disulfide bond formation protein DsbB [Metabacillus iocasae]
MQNLKKETLLFVSWGVSFIATLGSLFFSEIMRYIPCELCWYQRIFMYPLVIVLGVAYAKKDYGVAKYALPLSIIGGSISIYHYLIQKVPAFSSAAMSCGVVPCMGQYINWLGFITIPFLALTAFIIITVCHIFIIRQSREG